MDAPNATVVWTVRPILEQNSLKFRKVNCILIHLISSAENFFRQYISTWICENRVSKHFAIPINSPCLSLFTVMFAFVASFFGCFVVRDLWRFGCTQNFGKFAFFLATSPPPPSLEGMFPFLPRILCLTPWQLFETSARLKLVSAPLSSLYFATLRNVSRRASCKALRWTKLIRLAESTSSSIESFSGFIWLNGSITLACSLFLSVVISRVIKYPNKQI